MNNTTNTTNKNKDMTNNTSFRDNIGWKQPDTNNADSVWLNIYEVIKIKQLPETMEKAQDVATLWKVGMREK